jgi:hypothetical protein
MSINITERLRAARAKDRMDYVAAASKKLGQLRAGNSGIMSPEGDIAGGCHRVAHLRQLGIELDPPTPARLIMFEGGFANEDRIYSDLVKTQSGYPPGFLTTGTSQQTEVSGFANEVILREEEIPVTWRTKNGTEVTGRPDIVICEAPTVLEVTDMMDADKDPTLITIRNAVPKLGLELKSVNSVWVARDVLFSGKPKLDNICQAVHYGWKLNIPYKLIYRQYNIQVAPAFGLNAPAPGAPGYEQCEFNAKGKLKNIQPWELVYDLRINANGSVDYSVEGREQWTRTLVNTADIERYYEFVSEMAAKKTLGPKFLNIDCLGNELFRHEDYCRACAIAEETDQNYDDWLMLCKEEETADPSEELISEIKV